MSRGAGNTNKLIAALLILTAIVLIAGIAVNVSTMGMPAEETSGARGEVKLYVTGEEKPASTTGTVSLVVTGG